MPREEYWAIVAMLCRRCFPPQAPLGAAVLFVRAVGKGGLFWAAVWA